MHTYIQCRFFFWFRFNIVPFAIYQNCWLCSLAVFAEANRSLFPFHKNIYRYIYSEPIIFGSAYEMFAQRSLEVGPFL